MIFGPFERLVAMRYLRARRQEGFISVIAVFSLLGIALGVATLIVVVAVMNGFRQELLSRILGVNGALTVYAAGAMTEDYRDVVARIAKTEGVVSVTPRIEGQLTALSALSAVPFSSRFVFPSEFEARTDKDGHFELRDLPEGKISLQVRHNDYYQQRLQVSTSSGSVQIKLRPGIRVFGEVVDASTGQPLSIHSVSVLRSDREQKR